MERNITYDMTQGSPAKLIFKFSIPMLIGNLFQQFYNMVDLMVVGKFVGDDALGAVGSTGSLNFLFFSLCFGLSAGIGIIVAQYYGAKDKEHVMRTIANAFYVLAMGAFIMSVLGVCFSRQILTFLNTPEKIMNDAVVYMKVTCSGIIAVACYNGIASILRALGDSRTPLYFLIISSIINIALDLTFVIVFHLGVFGVALATILAQGISAIGCIIYAYKKVEYFRIPKQYYIPNRRLMVKTFRIGLPVALQNSMIAISCVALQRVTNSFGENVVSAYTAANRFEQLIHQPFNSLGAAISTYAGQNMGAGKIDRVKTGYHRAVVFCAIYSMVMIPVSHFGGEVIVSMFANRPEVISIGAHALKITSWFYFFLGLIYVTRGMLNGAGDTIYSMINGIVEVVGRVGFAKPLTMVPTIGVWGIWFTTGFTWTITGIISVIRYRTGKWKRKSIVKNKMTD